MHRHTPVTRAAHGWLALLLALPASAIAGQLSVTVTNTGNQPLADAVVYLLPKSTAALPAPRAALIDQKDRMFVPAVSVIQTGTPVSFPNSDNIRHQIYSFSPAKTFNLKLYSGKPANPVVFDKPGTVVLGCNIHDQMVAWVMVVDTAWFGKTDADGKTTLNNVPDGNYQLKLWHPGQRSEADTLSLDIKGSSNQSLVIDAVPFMKDMAHGAGH